MPGWSKKKRQEFERAFYVFLNNCFIDSKNDGFISLGANLYEGQVRFINCVLDAFEKDIHKIFVLKSRQLGLTTISRALSTFYLGIHSGLQGALVFDTSPNKDEARNQLENLIADLPKELQFPKIKTTNRDGLVLENKSKILFKSAGVKKTKSSGTLGRSVGLSMAHLSELCSYDNEEGLISFERSLSDSHPDRLYIYESTARGFNRWRDMWLEAREDDTHCACLFIGWWSHDGQRIERDSIDWEKYGTTSLTEGEKEKIKQVKTQYDYDVTMEQVAWYRRNIDPTAKSEGDADATFEANPYRLQEDPWTEEEAFQQTGAVFFPAKTLTEITNTHASRKFSTYMFMAGEEFTDMRIYKAENTRSIELKVWEDPDPEGVYVLGIDPAFGENENNCRSSIQIMRCYADGLDQVAEYAWPLINTRQFAWAIAALLGWYGAGRAEARYILELNGPGTAVFNEIRSLKFQIDNATYQRKDFEDKGLQDVFKNVKTYIYTRPDSMGAGYNYHFLTNTRLKITLFERLRDFLTNGKLRLRSLATIDELRTIAREGDTIGAPASMKDDRVMALGLATHYWDSRIRNQLITQRRTREAEASRKSRSIVDQVALFNQNHLDMFFGQKRQVRMQQMQLLRRQAWRSR